MFKKFLNLFPIFRRWQAEKEDAIRVSEEVAKLRIKMLENEIRGNKEEEEFERECRRKQDIRESLLENQKFLKLRISRQTF